MNFFKILNDDDDAGDVINDGMIMIGQTGLLWASKASYVRKEDGDEMKCFIKLLC